jgi:site-specific DNA-methyltransferase (adenine-specific)
MDFQSNHREIQHKKISNDKDEELLKWACSLKPRHSLYVFCRWDNLYSIPKPKSFIKWVKNNWSMGDLEHEHGRQTEEIAFYPGERHFWPHKRPVDVVYADKTGNHYHPTEKPVDLMAQVVRWTDGVVFDPFMGSCGTGLACLAMGRSFIGAEIDPIHFDTACRRIEEAYKQPTFFTPPPKKVIQEVLI